MPKATLYLKTPGLRCQLTGRVVAVVTTFAAKYRHGGEAVDARARDLVSLVRAGVGAESRGSGPKGETAARRIRIQHRRRGHSRARARGLRGGGPFGDGPLGRRRFSRFSRFSRFRGGSAEAKVDTSRRGRRGRPASKRLSPQEVRELRETWSRVWKEQLEAAERELEIAKDHVFQCRAASHYFFVPIAVDCNGVHERLAIAEYRLEEIRENQYNWELLLPEQPDEEAALVPERPRR